MNPLDQPGLPPFTPIPARPANPLQPEQLAAATAPKKRRAKKPVEKKTKAPKKTAKKPAKAPNKKQAAMLAAAREAIKARGVNPEPAKRTRSTRVAPLMLDAAQALTALAGLGKTEVTTMRAIIELLNPLARPARKRVLGAVLSLMGN